ncbi:MAG: InlB B-repeat-containing protein [Clostridia bacterium]|nr:InlB B-repeat-containing protein [Clostridia bacterium]
MQSSQSTVPFGAPVSSPRTPQKEYYDFTGWDKVIPDTMPAQNLEFNAVFKAIEYTATFTADGETVKEVKFTVENDSIDEPAVPEKEGYEGKWSAYTLAASDITIPAEYTPIEYTATFVDENGETVEEVKFTVETEKLDEPAVPEKTNYTGEWEEYTLGANDITIKPVYTLAGETVVNTDSESEITTDYKESKRFSFEPEFVPEGATAHVFYNGEDRGEGTSIEVKEPTEDYTVECKVLDADGNEIASSGEIKVKVKNSFFDRLKWFFNNFWANILKTFIDAIIKAC